jgi:hypothetical protein
MNNVFVRFGLNWHKAEFHGEQIKSKFGKVTLRNRQYLKDVSFPILTINVIFHHKLL